MKTEYKARRHESTKARRGTKEEIVAAKPRRGTSCLRAFVPTCLFFAPSLAIATILLLLNTGCTTEPPSSADREVLQDDVVAALHQMYAQDSTLQPFLARSAGYAIFPAVGKGAIGIGGAYGRGQVYKSGQFIGYADISQATIGLQVGGQGYSEILAFETPDALSNFEGGRFTFAATASAVIIKAGAGAAAKYDEGVSTFINPNGGLMLEAAIGGQSFSYQPK